MKYTKYSRDVSPCRRQFSLANLNTSAIGTASYFNEAGTVIQSEQDFAIQIPIETLRQCPNIIGVCSANTSVKALEGTLRTGIFTHLAARSKLVKALLDN